MDCKSNRRNRSLREFWAGYRNARIAAYLMLNENRDMIARTLADSGKSEQYVNGFLAGAERISTELQELLTQEAAYADETERTDSVSDTNPVGE